MPEAGRFKATDEPVTDSARQPLVLIADAHADSRAMLTILLGSAGYRTAECDGGDGAVDHVRRLLPDVVVLSTSSWGDSLEIVRAVQSDDRTSRTRFVLITGHGDPSYRQRALDAGCDACLLKPVDLDELTGALLQITGKPIGASASSALRRPTSDARRVVDECSSSIQSAKVALQRARTVSARAATQVERANKFLERVSLGRARANRS